MKKILLCVLFLAVLLPISAKQRAKHVVIIGLDGWGSYSFEQANIPTIKKLLNNGASTLNKRSVLPSSSAVNWASMFMGAGPELHGYTTWGSKTPELTPKELNQNGIFPTIFQLLRDNNPKAEIGCFSEWIGIKYLIDTLAVNTYQQAPDYKKNPEGLCIMGENYIKEKKPNLLALIWDNPDHIGHQVGHDTDEYYSKLEELDTYVARIVNAVDESGMLPQTVFIVTSDHGGINKGHGAKTMREMETPFIISGKNIKKGFKIEDSMMQFDCASTIAYIFDIKQPQVWIGRPMKSAFK